VTAGKILRVGLTGSIGMGKSTTAQMFRDEGIAVLDSDQIVHDLYRGAAVAPIAAAFPDVVVDSVVNRSALGAHVLSDQAAMEKLEAIVHPLVWAARDAFIQQRQAQGDWIVVYDVPLLFETGADKSVDAIVVVTAPPELQKQRVLMRPGMTQEKFEAIAGKQTPDTEKRARADFIVETGEGLDAARAQVRHILKTLREDSRWRDRF
jgi:dephospho-CoA kinase